MALFSRKLLLCAPALALASDYSPAFLWSPRAGQQTEHLAAVSGLDVERMSNLFAASSPEVQLVFTVEGLGTEMVRQHGESLASVDGLLQQSASSLTMPFTTAHDEKLFSSAVRVPGAQAEEYFKAHASLFDNGVADVVVVELPTAGALTHAQLAAHDALVHRVTKLVDAGTHGNYAALLTAMRGAVSHGVHRRLAAKAAPYYLHTTPTLLTAQLVMLMLIVIFLAGFCCLFSLQTPKRFEDTSKAEH